jgi:hypothetical protein
VLEPDRGGRVRAELLFTEGAGRLGERFSTAGAFAQIPLALRWRIPEAGGASIYESVGEPLEGRVAFSSARWGEIELGPTAMPLRVAGDGLVLSEPLRVPLFDGTVEVRDMRLADAFSPDRHLEAEVTLRDLSLERISEALGLPELCGEIDGSFPQVTVRGDALTTEGESEVTIFDGRVVFDDVSASDLTSPFPHLEFTAEFEGIDLEQLTQTLEFGRITGVLRGELREAELVGATPVRLLGEMRTVKRPGIPQRLNIRAVNNLTLLGTGSDASFLERGLRSLVDTYPYEAIGIAVLLEGDDFVLRGLERRGEKELFLKGRWPLRLDIVNAVPGTRVSYEAMTSRIGNLQIRRGDQPPPEGGSP